MHCLKKFIRILLYMLPIFLLCTAWSPVSAADNFLIIAHPEIPVDSLSQKMVADIYQGYKGKWADGQTIKVVMLKQGATHEAFSRSVVHLSPAKLKRLWKKVIFSGSGIAPKILRSEEKCVNYIAATRGAIGYINPATSFAGVKVIDIQRMD